MTNDEMNDDELVGLLRRVAGERRAAWANSCRSARPPRRGLGRAGPGATER